MFKPELCTVSKFKKVIYTEQCFESSFLQELLQAHLGRHPYKCLLVRNEILTSKFN